MKKKQKRGKPGPTQILETPPHEETGQAEWQRRQRALGRKLGAEKRHLGAQFTKKDLAAIDDYRRDHPRHANNNTYVAKELQRKPATRVFYLKKGRRKRYTVEALARKIGREHPQK